MLFRSQKVVESVQLGILDMSLGLLSFVSLFGFEFKDLSIPRNLWEEVVAPSETTSSVSTQLISDQSLYSQSDSEAHSEMLLGNRRKKAKMAPPVMSARRGLRSDKEGYVHQMLPAITRKKKASASLAPVPADLQIATMQQMGVELCGMDIDELAEDKLLKPRQT